MHCKNKIAVLTSKLFCCYNCVTIYPSYGNLALVNHFVGG